MATGRVTADTVNALTPGPARQFLWDDKLAGFGVKVMPSGAKIYILQYRLGGRGHKTKRFTIGPEGSPWRPTSARKEAERLLALVKQGVDVSARAKETARIAVELAFTPYVEAFIAEPLKAHWPKSHRQTGQCLTIHAARHLGDKPLPDVGADDVRKLLARLNPKPATKRNLFSALSYLFNRSLEDGDLIASPMAGMKPPPMVEERSRVLDDDELRWLWNAAEQEEATYRGIVRHLITWGQRRSEVGGLPWKDLSRASAEWHLPKERAKNGSENVIPLTADAIATLDVIAGGVRWPRTGLVFPSSAGTPPSGFSKLKKRLDARMEAEASKVGATIAPWRLHDLRRTLATYMQRLGVPFEVIEHLLNHRERARTGIGAVYQRHDFKPEKLDALEKWERELARIIERQESSVVPFSRRA